MTGVEQRWVIGVDKINNAGKKLAYRMFEQ